MRRKYRLVAQNYQDEEEGRIATKAPTFQIYSQCLLLCFAASEPNMTLCTRDVAQTYVQRNKTLQRPVYMETPDKMNIPGNVVIQVLRPLYGIPERGLHWYLTYLEYHMEALGMILGTVYLVY